MDYDKIFERDINTDFFYSNYSGRKMVVGKINLNNAIARLSKNEFYTLVTYNEGEVLPEQYIPLNNLTSDDGTLFATLNPNIRYINYICMNGGIQQISVLPQLNSGGPRYLLGPGPDIVTLEELIMSQYNKYMEEKVSSSRKGR